MKRQKKPGTPYGPICLSGSLEVMKGLVMEDLPSFPVGRKFDQFPSLEISFVFVIAFSLS